MTTRSTTETTDTTDTTDNAQLICSRCNNPIPPQPPNSFTTGYGKSDDGSIQCYQCCGEIVEEFMRTHDRITLYLSKDRYDWIVGNWPSSITFPADVNIAKNAHNWGLQRRDAWFIDNEGKHWWGVSYGAYTQLLHCRKLKRPSFTAWGKKRFMQRGRKGGKSRS